ncbi:hypothetical protein BG004_001134 [Podila humilis]|nr:hypothetical protein BG004_001134 [Podila humilis]
MSQYSSQEREEVSEALSHKPHLDQKAGSTSAMLQYRSSAVVDGSSPRAQSATTPELGEWIATTSSANRGNNNNVIIINDNHNHNDNDNHDYDSDSDMSIETSIIEIADSEDDEKEERSSDDEDQKTGSTTTGNNNSKDDLTRGADFVGFLDSEDEETDEDEEEAKDHQQQGQNSLVQGGPGAVKGHKRKRDDEDDIDTNGPSGMFPWMGHRQYSKLGSVPRMLTQEVKDFVDYISPTPEEHKVREYVHQRVQETIAKIWSDAQVIVFGSFNTRLYLPSSDMDIVLLRKHAFSLHDLDRVAQYLRRDGVAKNITVLKHTRVPLVKFTETISDLPVDISFGISNGIESANIAKSLMEKTPALRPLTLVVKHFLLTRDMNEVFRGGIGSYTTMIMILSFLQMHPKVQAKAIDPMDNLGVLLVEFFELYGTCYNYDRVGLSVIRNGFYFDKVRKPVGEPNVHGRPGAMLLCTVDPNDTTNDTAKGSYQLRRIRELFLRAFGALARNMKECRQTFFPSLAGAGGGGERRRHIRFDDHNRVPADSVTKSSGVHRYNDAQISLLKDVLWIPPKILEQRRYIKEVFYSGEYQKIFGDPPGITGLDPLSLQ